MHIFYLRAKSKRAHEPRIKLCIIKSVIGGAHTLYRGPRLLKVNNDASFHLRRWARKRPRPLPFDSYIGVKSIRIERRGLAEAARD
jgi:hypothetical protein